MKVTPEVINHLRHEFGKHATVPMRSADKLIALMDKADENALRLLAAADIKFVSLLAKGRLVRANRK